MPKLPRPKAIWNVQNSLITRGDGEAEDEGRRGKSQKPDGSTKNLHSLLNFPLKKISIK